MTDRKRRVRRFLNLLNLDLNARLTACSTSMRMAWVGLCTLQQEISATCNSNMGSTFVAETGSYLKFTSLRSLFGSHSLRFLSVSCCVQIPLSWLGYIALVCDTDLGVSTYIQLYILHLILVRPGPWEIRCMWSMKNIYVILVGKPEKKRLLEA